MTEIDQGAMTPTGPGAPVTGMDAADHDGEAARGIGGSGAPAGLSDAGPIAPLPHDPLPPMPLARLYLTGDLRAAAGISRTHMDYYLREGLIRPTAKTAGGYLLFDDRELQLLRWVIAARAAGGSLRQIRERLGR